MKFKIGDIVVSTDWVAGGCHPAPGVVIEHNGRGLCIGLPGCLYVNWFDYNTGPAIEQYLRLYLPGEQ